MDSSSVELFLGKPGIFWTALYTIITLGGTIILAITGYLVYKQLRTGVKAFQSDGIRKMQEMVDVFRDDRVQIYATFPIGLVLSSSQFAKRPPARTKKRNISKKELLRMPLTDEQNAALRSLTKEQLEIAIRVIGKLNDIGQLVEDGLIEKRIFLGKYHMMIIRLCHFLEGIRRQEELRLGGNYGQRLLRMRYDAIRYNILVPKHRMTDIKITTSNGSKEIVTATEGTVFQRVFWQFQRIIIL